MSTTAAAAATAANPFVGPRAFKTGERLFGRDFEAREMFGLLVSERIVVLHAPSGAGKTSLLQAALIPRLEGRRFRVWPTVRVNAEPAEGDAGADGPNRYLLSVLRHLEKGLPEDRRHAAETLRAMALSDYFPGVAAGRDGAAEAGANGARKQVLIFDQFEEILTVAPHDLAAKHAFFEQVGALLRSPSLYVVFALRDEYVGGLEPYRRWVPGTLETRFRLELLGRQAAWEAIVGPARDSAAPIAEDAATALVENLSVAHVYRDGRMEEEAGTTVEPVQLQVVCYRLWERHHAKGTIGADLVRGQGGEVDAALAEFYQEQIKAICAAPREGGSRVPERALRDWCEGRLITPQGTRGQVPAQDLGSIAPEALIKDLSSELEAARLVRRDERHGLTWLELTHDRLIDPLRTNNAAWREANLQPFQRRAALWKKEPSDDLLLGPADLDAAEVWAAAHPPDASAGEADYLRASREAIEAVEYRRRMEQGRLEADRRTEALRLEAARHRRKASRLWGGIAAAAVALVVLVIAAGQYRKLARLAEQERNRAHARRLAALSYRLDDRPDTAALLALEAYRIDTEVIGDPPSAETLGGLLHVVDREPRLLGVRRGPALFTAGVAFRPPAGDILAAVGDDREVFLFNTRTNTSLGVLRDAGAGATALAFSPDGATLAVGGLDGTVALYNARAGHVDGAPSARLPARWAPGHQVRAVEFDPKKTDDLAWAAGPDVVLFNRRTNTARTLRADQRSDEDQSDPAAVNDLAFHPKHPWLATAGANGKVLVWSQDDPQGKTREHDLGNAVNEVAFSPDGRTLAAAGWSGTLTLLTWPEPPAAEASSPPALNESLRRPIFSPSLRPVIDGLAFSPKGRVLATADWGGTIILWDLGDPEAAPSEGGPQIVAILPAHDDIVSDLAFHPEDDRLASASWDRTARLWDATIVREPARTKLEQALGLAPQAVFVPGALPTIRHVAPMADGRTVALVLGDGELAVWEVGAAVVRKVAGARTPGIERVSFSPQGAILAAPAAEGGVLLLWDAAVGRTLRTIRVAAAGAARGGAPMLRSAVFSPDGGQIAAVDDAGAVYVCDAAGGRAPRPLVGSSGVRGLAFVGGGRWVVAGGTGPVTSWDAATGRRLSRPGPGEGHDGWVWAVAAPPDGPLAATGATDGIRLWALDGGKLRLDGHPLRQHHGTVRSLDFRPDGALMASGGEDGVALLWSRSPGGWQPIGPLLRGTDLGVPSAAVAAPVFLAPAGRFGHAPASVVFAPGPRQGSIWSVAFQRDEKTLLTAGDRTRLQRHAVDTVSWRERARALAGRGPDLEECELYRLDCDPAASGPAGASAGGR